MAKASKMFTYGGKGTTQKPQYGKETTRQIIRQCRKEGANSCESDVLRVYRAATR